MNYPCEDCSEYEKEIKDLRRRNAALENAIIASDKECERLRSANAQLTKEILTTLMKRDGKYALLNARVKRYEESDFIVRNIERSLSDSDAVRIDQRQWDKLKRQASKALAEPKADSEGT